MSDDRYHLGLRHHQLIIQHLHHCEPLVVGFLLYIAQFFFSWQLSVFQQELETKNDLVVFFEWEIRWEDPE